jgi:hypothetical protein
MYVLYTSSPEPRRKLPFCADFHICQTKGTIMPAQALRKAIKAQKAAVEKALAGIAELEAHISSVQADASLSVEELRIETALIQEGRAQIHAAYAIAKARSSI